MDIFCTTRFKEEFLKLCKKNPHKGLEEDLINYFFNKPLPDLMASIRLNNSATEPYIKKRLDGRGGYRVYFLLIIKNDSLYLMFLHPKTGPGGSDNITDNAKALIYKEVYKCITDNELIKLSLDQNKKTILFIPVVSGRS